MSTDRLRYAVVSLKGTSARTIIESLPPTYSAVKQLAELALLIEGSGPPPTIPGLVEINRETAELLKESNDADAG